MQDPRPRPFYCTAARINFEPLYTSGGFSELNLGYDYDDYADRLQDPGKYQPFLERQVNGEVVTEIYRDWDFIRMPNEVSIPTGLTRFQP